MQRDGAQAILRLRRTDDGGLEAPVTSPTRGLLLDFVDPNGPSGHSLVGVVIDVGDGQSLEPGREEIHATITPIFPENARFLTVGARFDLWMLRILGDGVIVAS